MNQQIHIYIQITMDKNIGAAVFKNARQNEQCEERLRIDCEKNEHQKKITDGVASLERHIDAIRCNKTMDRMSREFICGRVRYTVYDMHVPCQAIKLVNKKYKKSNIVISDTHNSYNRKWYTNFDFYDDGINCSCLLIFCKN